MPSTLTEISEDKVKINQGQDNDGAYEEIIVPDEFAPGSILVFATDINVG
jgi:glycogen debranching enzyme